MEIIECRNEEREEWDVGTPPAMVDDDYRTVKCSPMESVKGGRLQEVVNAWQGLYLRNKAVAIVQKLLLLRLKTTKRIDILRPHCQHVSVFAPDNSEYTVIQS